MAGWLKQVPNKIKRLFSVSFTKSCPTDDIRYEDNHYRYTQSKKQSMYLTSMTHEELYAEVHKDLIEISTQANMFMDKVRKKTKNMLPYPLATQRITLTTTRRNVWTVVGKHNSYMQGVGFQAYAPVIGASSNGYIQMSGFKPRDMVMHYTAHFMQRYKERYIDHYQIDRKGENLFEYFVYNNPQVLYTRKNNGGYFIVSDHGIAVADFSDGLKLMTHVTFLGDDELTLKKQLIYDEEIKIYKGALELKRLKSRKQKDDLVTIWNVAKKHNAGIEMVKRWYQWNGVKVDEDYLQQCIDLIEKYNVQSLDQFAELMSRQ